MGTLKRGNKMKLTNTLNLPKPIYNALLSDYKYKEKQFSATSIIGGLKALILQKRHSDKIEVDISEMTNLLFGIALHKVLEESEEEKDELKEAYLKYELPNGYNISGRFDLYNESEKAVKDYKTCVTYKIKLQDFKDWKLQLSIYAWLLNKLGFPTERGEIVYFIKDWKKRELSLSKLKNEYYPETQIGVKKFEFTKQDMEETEKYIINRFNTIERYEQMEDDDIPPCSKEERFNQGDQYAVMKKGKQRAIRVYDSLETAEEHLKIASDTTLTIEVRVGRDTKCIDYCNANQFCNYYKEHVIKGAENHV